jgi:mRNA-degrading endonuclease toxin of MazEF toxin-antitoxin module
MASRMKKSIKKTIKRIFGPYKGSEQNGGRPIYVIKKRTKDGKVVTTSSNKARVDYEKATGKTLPRGTEVDHKNNGGRAGDDRMSNLRTISKKKNVGLENKRRAKKTTAKKATKKT